MVFKKVLSLTSILFSVLMLSSFLGDDIYAQSYKCKYDSTISSCVPCLPDPNNPESLGDCEAGFTCNVNETEAQAACAALSPSQCPATGQQLSTFETLQCATGTTPPPGSQPACETHPNGTWQCLAASQCSGVNDPNYSCSNTGTVCCRVDAAPPIPPPSNPALDPIPDPTVQCDDIEENEFHSLRPYQASVCNTEDYQTALYCGNSVFLTDTFSVSEEGVSTPADPGQQLLGRNCVERPEFGVTICDYTLQRDKTFSINLNDLEFPIAGNTEDVRNIVKRSTDPEDESISDTQKINEYVSWYLQGVPNGVEYGRISNSQPLEGVNDSMFPKNINGLINMSGPLNKLLPLRIQQRERMEQVTNAANSLSNRTIGIDQRHDQIVGCTRTFSAPLVIGPTSFGNYNFTFQVACNGDGFWTGVLFGGPDEHRLSEWNGAVNIPPKEEAYQDRTFIEYWEDYKEWRGELCTPITIAGITLLLCANVGDQPPATTRTFVAQLFPFIPLSSTEDTIGKVRVEQNPLPLGQSDPITITNETVSRGEANIYVPHMAENYQLADTLQQTFVSKDLDLNAPADQVTVVGDEFCNVVQVKNNPGDHLFGDEFTPRLSYTSEFSCQWVLEPKGRTSSCTDASQQCRTVCEPDPLNPSGPEVCREECDSDAQCFPSGYGSCDSTFDSGDCGTNYKCAEGCEAPDVEACQFSTEHSIPVYTETPYLDDIWSKLVAGPTSVFKRIFPKIGIDGPLSEIIDAPSSASTTYTTTNPGTTISAGDARSGVAAELYFPHLGGIHEYFLECIQTALRPQGLGRECGNFTSPEDLAIVGNLIDSFIIRVEGKFPQIASSGINVHLTSNPLARAAYWQKTETAQTFGTPYDLGSATGDANYTSVGNATDKNGVVYTTWIDELRGGSNPHGLIYFAKKEPTGWSARIRVAEVNAFPAHARITVSSTGQIFVIWYQTDIMFSTSVNGGQNWSVPRAVGRAYGGSETPSIAAGNDGQVALAYTDVSVNKIMVGIWNGNTFALEEATRTLPAGQDKAGPSITIAPDGTIYTAWRDHNARPVVGKRENPNTWSITNIQSPGQIYGSISLNADSNGGLHLFWVTGSGNSAHYTYKSLTGPWLGTQLVAQGDNFLANADGVPSSGGRYYHGVAEEHYNGGSYIRYYLISGGGTGTSGPIGGGGTGTTAPPGECSLTEGQVRQNLTSWGLPQPDSGWQTAFNTISNAGSSANWSALSMLDGERRAGNAGGFPVIQYLTTAWVWFESGSGYPNLYAVNCDDRGISASQVSAYCGMTQGQVIGPRPQDFQFQIAGYQAMESNKNYQTAFTRLYAPSQLVERLNDVISNSNKSGRNGWSYLNGNGSGLLRFIPLIPTATINDLASRGPDLVPFVHDETVDRRQFFSLLIGKDPAMVAAFNSIAVSNADLVAKLKNPSCGNYYCSGPNRQRLANYVYALRQLDCSSQ